MPRYSPEDTGSRQWHNRDHDDRWTVEDRFRRTKPYEDPLSFAVPMRNDENHAEPDERQHDHHRTDHDRFRGDGVSGGYEREHSWQFRGKEGFIGYPNNNRAGFQQRSPIRHSPTPPPPPTSPSPEYMDTAESGSYMIDPTSSRKLLVLDLNGTLLFRSGNRSGGLRPTHPRPYMPSFRKYLLCAETMEWLDVMVWSSAQPHSVADMVGKCFEDERHNLVAVWARDTLGLSRNDYSRKSQTTKNLEKPWAQLPLSRTYNEQPNRHSARSTLLLDDSPLKARLQPYNHVCLPEYDGNQRAHDVALATYLNAIDVLHDTANLNGDPSQQSPTGSDSNIIDSISDEVHIKKRKGRSPSHEPAVSPHQNGDDINSPTSEGSASKHGKKKKKRLRALQEYVDQHAPPVRKFDEILLAVIGILDAAMMQSNMAGWIMDGGLWAVHENGASTSPKVSPSDPFDEPATSPPSSSPPANSDGFEAHIADHHGGGAAGNDRETFTSTGAKEAADSEPISPRMWFEDKANMSYWIDRGRRALQELNIEEEPGVRVQ